MLGDQKDTAQQPICEIALFLWSSVVKGIERHYSKYSGKTYEPIKKEYADLELRRVK